MRYYVEADMAVDAAGTVLTKYHGTKAYQPKSGDPVQGVFYEGDISNPGRLVRTMFGNSTTGGVNEVGYGVVELVNTDGHLDALVDHSQDGRGLRFYAVDDEAPFSSRTLVARATMDQGEGDFRRFAYIARDRLAELDLPLCKTQYGGTNVLPAGVDGSVELKGRRKPRTYGNVNNVTPVCINTSRLIYQVNDGAILSIPTAWDKGVALTKGADYVSQADMETNAPAASNFRVWPAGGMVRLGTKPVGQFTCEVVEGANAATRTVAQLVKRIALDAGILNADISATDVTALDTANSAEVGIYVDDESVALDAISELANSIGAFVGFDALGVLRMGRLEVPSGTPSIVLDRTNILSIKRERSRDADRGIPAYRVNIGYKKNYTVQSSDLAGGITDDRRTYIGLPYLLSKSEDASVKTKHKLAPEITRATLLTTSAAADAEAARLLEVYKARRGIYTVDIKFRTVAELVALDLNKVAQITYGRFGMNAGKLFRVLGVELDFRKSVATLTVWG
jgi:hypothetical protein